MRMWMLPVECMCMKHIVGEHGEIHKHLHNFIKKHNMNKRLSERQIFPSLMKNRHDELAVHMNHKSKYEQPDISYLEENGLIIPTYEDLYYNMKDLISRCPFCRSKINKLELDLEKLLYQSLFK